MESVERPAAALVRVVVARREQLAFRIGISVAIAGLFQVLTGWKIALAWVAAYMLVQLAEYRLFRDVSSTGDLGRGRSGAVLAVISAGTLLFGALGALTAVHAGPWGSHARHCCGRARS